MWHTTDFLSQAFLLLGFLLWGENLMKTVKILTLYYAGIAFTMGMISGDNNKCGIGIRNKRITVLK
jgi:hypothetical protein